MTTGLTPPCSGIPVLVINIINISSSNHSFVELEDKYVSLQSHASHSIGKASFARERFKSAICEYPSFKELF